MAGYGASMMKYAVRFGLVGFAGGFFGPMILTPEANQGPMLGIFITGPLGFLAGLVCGAISAWRKRRAASGGS